MHYGHIGLVKWIIEHTDLDEIWMLVSPNNPLKDSKILADEKKRLADLRTALKDLNDKRIKPSDFEFNLPRPTYTAATLQKLHEQYPEHEFVLIIGQDNWDIFEQWRDYDEILRQHEVIVYPRRQTTGNRRQTTGDRRQDSSNKGVTFLTEAPYFDISSTEIRNKSI